MSDPIKENHIESLSFLFHSAYVTVDFVVIEIFNFPVYLVLT